MVVNLLKGGLDMTIMNEIGIVQNCYTDRGGQTHNEYYFYTEKNIYLGCVSLPGNGQFMEDAKALNIITKALALRWGLISAKGRRG